MAALSSWRPDLVLPAGLSAGRVAEITSVLHPKRSDQNRTGTHFRLNEGSGSRPVYRDPSGESEAVIDGVRQSPTAGSKPRAAIAGRERAFFSAKEVCVAIVGLLSPCPRSSDRGAMQSSPVPEGT